MTYISKEEVLKILEDAIQESDDFSLDIEYLEWSKKNIEELPTIETEWISVNERLPEEWVEVLTNYKWLYYWIAHIEWDLWWVDSEYSKNSVSHWMPLPPNPNS